MPKTKMVKDILDAVNRDLSFNNALKQIVKRKTDDAEWIAEAATLMQFVNNPTVDQEKLAEECMQHIAKLAGRE